MPDEPVKPTNLPNLLTLSRLCATPFIVWLMYGRTPCQRYAALVLFLLAAATDAVDGVLARRGSQTVLGNYLDKVADKVLVLCVFVALADVGALPLWMALVLIAREFVVSGVRDVAAARGKVVGANWMGKVKMDLQVITIAWGLFLLGPSGAPPEESSQTLSWLVLKSLAWVTVLTSTGFAIVFVKWHWRQLAGSTPDRT